jgi:[ribosomal protein S5]-alanine N-acetyltransferase
MKLVGDKVYLQSPKVADAERILVIINDQKVRPMLGIKNQPKRNLQDERKWIRRQATRRRLKEAFNLLIIEKETDKIVGMCGLHYDKYHKKADIGISIAPKFWNKKYGREAITMLLCCCFKKLELDLVIAQAYDFNDRSKSLLDALGFNHDATLRKCCLKKDGSRCSLNHFSITKEEHKSKCSDIVKEAECQQ